MQNSLQQLKVAQNKFMESKACMEKFTPENEGKIVVGHVASLSSRKMQLCLNHTLLQSSSLE